MAQHRVVSDPLFPLQWHLRNTGQQTNGLGGYDTKIDQAWVDYTGRGVLVGVNDDGFDETHPDLIDNYRADLAYDFLLNRPGAKPPGISENHGTATLGLIVETGDNGIGGVGVAFGAMGTGYRILEPADASQLPVLYAAASAKALADGVDIVNNSWGSTRYPFVEAGVQASYLATMTDLVQQGRDGLGIISVFSAGNEHSSQFLSTYSPTANSPYAITVAASKATGQVAGYSTWGSSVLVAAPGSDPRSIVTTDRQGGLGYNDAADGDYTNTALSAFNGTSAAAPIVSGIVALMLEANPNLGYRDVQEILAYSAHWVTGADAAHPGVNSATDWNGGGLRYSDELGFGNVDALAAVRLAESWGKQSTFGNLVDVAGTVDTASGVAEDGIPLQLTAQFSDAVRVQHVMLTVDLSTTALGAMQLKLYGPQGNTVSYLINEPRDIPSSLTHLTYTFDTVHNWGELANAGTWKLEVQSGPDTAQAVTINSWSIHVLGDMAEAGQTYIYTDDYSGLALRDTARQTLSNANGAVHTLNLAATTTDNVVDLHAGVVGRIANAPFQIGAGTLVGTIISGDGNDHLIGDSNDNRFIGGRGSDVIEGGGGIDTAAWLGARGHYSVEWQGSGYRVTDLARGDVDTLTGISLLEFSDGLALHARGATDDALGVGALYNALLGRAPEAGGFRYWTDLSLSAPDLHGLAQGFTQSAEYLAGIGGADDATFVNALYTRLLGRAAEADGFAAWTHAAQSGVARSDIALGFIESTEFTTWHLSTVMQQVSHLGDVWSA